MFSFENRVGRLLEVRIAGELTPEEAQQFRTKMFLALTSITGRAVLIGEMRHCDLFVGEVRDRMVAMLKHDNPKVERTAFVVTKGSLAKQIEDIVAEAAREALAAGKSVPPRQVFYDARKANTWLAEVLSPAEKTRLQQFLPE